MTLEIWKINKPWHTVPVCARKNQTQEKSFFEFYTMPAIKAILQQSDFHTP